MPGPTVTMIDRDGDAFDVPVEDVESHKDRGFRVEGTEGRAARNEREALDNIYGGVAGKIGTTTAGALRGATVGLTDLAAVEMGGEAARQQLETYKRLNPELSTVSEIAGAVATVLPSGGQSFLARTPAGLITKLGANVAKAGEGASIATRVGRAAAGGFVEGAGMGAGSGISELALSDKPVDLERAISTISSHALYGGAIGGVAGSVGKVAEIGLAKAKGAIDSAVARHEARAVTSDLAEMDVKQLRAAAETEREAIKVSHKADLEAIEATRVAERQSIADDLAALRREVKDTNQWATTKDVKMPAVEGKLSAAELGRISSKAEKQLAGALDNPIGLAKNPTKALDALQRQEHALTQIINHSDDLRLAYAADEIGGKRVAALEAAPQLLEKNRALQARIAEVSKALPEVPKTSPRLDAIETARETLATTGKPGAIASIPQRMLEGSAYGTVSGMVAALPIPGAAMAAPMVGAAVSKMLGEKVFGRLGKAAADQAVRTSKVVSSFLGPAQRATSKSVPVATKVLSSVRFAARPEPTPAGSSEDRKPRGQTELAALFHERANEVRAQTAYGLDGKPVMRETARAELADRLKGIAALDPHLADKLETIAARRIEFLAEKLPRRPDIAGIPIGPDRWQPSDMAMRKWARYVAGVEDPGAIEERLSHGTVSVEDAEVMREVYPERLAELTRQIVDQMPSVRMLPYQKRLALSVLTGVPVVAAMDPRIRDVLQSTFAGEAEPPIATPQFGSVSAKSAPEPTPAQSRAG